MLPVPSIVAGVESTLAVLAPQQLPLWEKLRLEPAFARISLTYTVMAPLDARIATTKAATALALAYEMCSLGSMAPFAVPYVPLDTTVGCMILHWIWN